MMMSPLLIDEPPLQILPTLAVKIGLNEAIVLQQVHYWLSPRHNKTVIHNRCWVNHTYQEWQKQFPFWSLKTIQRVLNQLEEMGLLITYVSKEFQKAKFYSLNYDTLLQLSTSDFAISGSCGEETGSGFSVWSDCPNRSGQFDQIT